MYSNPGQWPSNSGGTSLSYYLSLLVGSKLITSNYISIGICLKIIITVINCPYLCGRGGSAVEYQPELQGNCRAFEASFQQYVVTYTSGLFTLYAPFEPMCRAGYYSSRRLIFGSIIFHNKRKFPYL